MGRPSHVGAGHRALIAALAAIATTVTGGIHAQEWPSRPIRIIAPSTPGGAADLFSRLLCEQFAETLPHGCFVENRAGAGGLIATQVAAQAEPNGYTLTISSLAYHVIAPATRANPGFDPIRDFTHIAYLGGPPNVFVVNPSLGARALNDIATIAARRGPLDYVSPGVGTLGHLLAEAYAERASIRLQQIMTKGASQGLMDLVAGSVQLGSMTWTSALGSIRSGQVIPIVLSSRQRLTDFPDVPTFADEGLGELTAVSWFGLSAPAGLPAAITTALNRQVIEILSSPKVRAQMLRDSIETRALTSEEFTRLIEDEIRRWTPFAKRLMAQH